MTDNTEYFECGNIRIPIVEHFQESGETLIELLKKLIIKDIQNDSNT